MRTVRLGQIGYDLKTVKSIETQTGRITSTEPVWDESFQETLLPIDLSILNSHLARLFQSETLAACACNLTNSI